MTALIIGLLKMLGGPGLVLVLRKVAPVFLKKAPAALQPILAAVVNVVIAISTGVDPVLSLAALVEAVKVFFATGGIVKFGIDMPKGKSNTVTGNDKAFIDHANGMGPVL